MTARKKAPKGTWFRVRYASGRVINGFPSQRLAVDYGKRWGEGVAFKVEREPVQ